MHYYEVAPLAIVRGEAEFFTYESDNELAVGTLVYVPLGKKKCIGVVFRAVDKPSFDTRPIIIMSEQVCIPSRILDIAKWISEYYCDHLSNVLQTVLPRGIEKTRRSKNEIEDPPDEQCTQLLLNDDQMKVIENISKSKGSTTLLHGITGSGKTNVYIKLAGEMLVRDKSAIILVPEIALTSQIVENFRSYYGNQVVVVHSQQTESQRHRIWQKVIRSKIPLVVIGPRSSLFAPVRDLGIIIIDEAHEPSYKQDQNPKYNALRVATAMAKMCSSRVVLGSATPLVTDYYLAKNMGAISKLNRLAKGSSDLNKTKVEVVDMKNRELFKKHRFMSDVFLESVDESLSQGKQCLIFHNRRGSTNLTMCDRCGWQAVCDKCLIPLTLHGDKYKFLCHTCGSAHKVMSSCPECSNTNITHKGIGTKLIESEMRKIWPKVNIARFDRDTPEDQSINNIYEDIKSGEVQIIIGTQAIAKGFDLPHLGMVGIVQADTGLMLPDFSSDERVFQLLSQVTGRVGRGHGEATIVVQTYQPEHEILKFGTGQDYESFYKYTINKRRKTILPPFCFLLKLTCIYKTERSAVENSQKMASEIKKMGLDIEILGPMPAFHERQGGEYCWQLVIKSAKRANLLYISKQIKHGHWRKDLDPYSLL